MSSPHGDFRGEVSECMYFPLEALVYNKPSIASCSCQSVRRFSADAMPRRSKRPVFSFSHDSWREPCLLVLEQGNDLMDLPTSCKDYSPRAPPPSPTKFNSSTDPNPDEAYPLTSCALHLVDRKIEAHQARLSPTKGSRYPPMPSNDVSGEKLKRSDEQMHRMTPLRQVSSASNDDDITVANSSSHWLRSSDITLVDDTPSDREIDQDSSIRYRRKLAKSSELEIESSSHFKSPAFGLCNIRPSREAVAGAPCPSRSRPHDKDVSRPCRIVTGNHISSPTPIGSTAKVNTAELPLEYEQSKARSWSGPCSQLSGPDTISMHRTTMRSKRCKCDFACACHRAGNAGWNGGMPSCGFCASRSGRRLSNKPSIGLRPSAEQAKAVMNKEQGVTVEEPRSHFSDDSTDDDEDESEKSPSNVRLFNSLGRLNQKSKTRLSLSNLFSKP